ncbi:MAG TPA: glycosyltransferase family 39 protein [Patescibacteria group bacterium]|nr:glycosyltransferase family 39 protein [Patescibacteria group bacterium]
MTFLGDEGRDVLVAKHILGGDFVFIGPRSSAADFFYGPIYYYLITPFLWLFNYDPVGPAVFVALISVATIYLVYKVGSVFFNKKAGLFAASLYTVSPLVIAYSRSSWNPNPLPFVSLLCLFTLYNAATKKSWKLYVLTGLLLGFALQMQYLALFLGIIVGTYVFVTTMIREKRLALLEMIKHYGQIILGFVIGFAPFLGYELVHNFPNTRTILGFIFVTNPNNPTAKDHPFFQTVVDAFSHLTGRLLLVLPPKSQFPLHDQTMLVLWQGAAVLLVIAGAVALIRLRSSYKSLLLFLWLVIGIGFFGFYKKQLYDYYFGFLFPLPFLLVGNLLSILISSKKLFHSGKVLGVILFVSIFLFNLSANPFRSGPNQQKKQVEEISDFVLSKADNKPFNFALITKGNSDHGYRYFFEVKGNKPIEIKNLQEDPMHLSVTDQLFVVCEYKDCKPLGYSLHEIAGFGRAEIADEWDISVVKVVKLVHFQENFPTQ